MRNSFVARCDSDIRVFLFPTKRYIRLKTQHNNHASSFLSLHMCVCMSVASCSVVVAVVAAAPVVVVVLVIAALAHHLCS